MEGFLDKTTLYTGRKAAVGKTVVVKDKDGRERIGVFVAYCPDCEYKVCLTRDDLRKLFLRCRKMSSSWRERLVRLLLRQLQYYDHESERIRKQRRVERHNEFIMQKY